MLSCSESKRINTGCLAKLLKLKTGENVMLTVNIDIQGLPINGQSGIVRHIEFAEGIAHKVYTKFSDVPAG